MTSLLTIRRSRKALLVAVATAFLVAVALVGSAAASWWYEENGTVNGTVEDTDWEGRASVGWKAPVPPGKIQYGGVGLTDADAVIDELYVKTVGSEWCGPGQLDIDWNKNAYVYDTWILGRSGSGSALSFSCLWHPYRNVTVMNQVSHKVWDGGEWDSDNHTVTLLTNLNP